jgi:O-antigen ligase
MIRYTLLWLFVGGLMRFAWRDWCKALCVLVTLLAVLERPDMPKSIFGIQGLNPFNVALLGILAAWFAQPPEKSDVPRWLTVLFSLYVGVMLISTLRLLLDPSYLMVFQHEVFEVKTRGSLIAEYFVNTFKWLIPAVLLVRGCRGEDRQRWLIVGVLGIYAVLAYLVIRQMPLGYLLDGERLQQRAADILQRRVGYHRVDLATMFAGASWAMLAVRPLFTSRWVRLGLVGLFALTALGLALTGGRAGYTTWCALGLIMSLLKWRRLLLLAPVAAIVVLSFAPGIAQRMLQGISGGNVSDQHLVTSGRNVVWPVVLNKIGDSPIVGFGRQAWARTNLRMEVGLRTGEFFGHPHNAYFEFALDNGLIGLAVLLPMMIGIVWKSARMFRSRDDPATTAAGGAALAMTLSLMIAGTSAQTFYPTEGSVGMWCVIALAIRVSQERAAPAVVIAPKVDIVGVPGQGVPAPADAWRRPAAGRPVTLWPEGQRRA